MTATTLVLIVLVLFVSLFHQQLEFASAASSFIDTGYANPNKRASYYMFDTQTGTATGTTALGTMYLFRQGKTLNSTVISGQRPLVSINGDVRRIILVEVASGTVSTELTTFDEVNFADPNTYTLHSTNFFAIAPLLREAGSTIGFSASSWSSVAHQSAFPNTTAFFENGTVTYYADFGVLEQGVDISSNMLSVSGGIKNSIIYQQRSSQLAGNPLLGFLLDSLPGDREYSPLRKIITVNVPNFKTSVAEVNQFTLSDTSSFMITPTTEIFGADTSAGTFSAELGYHAGKSLQFVSLNASRMGNMITNPVKGMTFAKMYRVSGQATPILEYAPGEAGYSDLLAIVDVVFAAGTVTSGVTFDSFSSLPTNSSYTFTGRYLNCPIFNSGSSFTSDIDMASTNLPPTTFSLFHNGATKTCFNFSYVETGCALRPNYELMRNSDNSIVRNNDIFPTAFETSLRAAPFRWKFTYPVEQLYITGTIKTFSSLLAESLTVMSQASYTIGTFSNDVIVSRSTLPSTASGLPTGQSLAKDSGLTNWTMDYWAPNSSTFATQNQVCFEVRAQFGHSAVAVGFGQDLTSASASSSNSSTLLNSDLQHSISNLFIVGHFTSSGATCVRTLLKSPTTGVFSDANGASLINLTNANFVLDDDTNAVKLQFCRNRYPLNSFSNLASTTVGILPTVERIEVATGPVRNARSSSTISQSDISTALPASCSTTLSTALWASVTRLQIDWTQYLPTAVVSPAFTTSTTTTVAPASTTTTGAPNTINSGSSGSGFYRLGENHVLSWRTLPAGQLNPTEVEFFLTFPATFYGWMAVGFGAATWVQSDIAFMIRHPELGLVIEDKKGITTSLWRNDAQQDWTFGDSTAVDPVVPSLITNTTYTVAFKRKIDSGDTGISTQNVARTELKAGTFSRATGWGGGFPIEVYNLENGPTFTVDNFTRSNVFYLMVNETTGLSGAANTWQQDLVDVVPGQEGYSDLWRVSRVTVPSSFKGPEITSVADIPESWSRTNPVSSLTSPTAAPTSWKNCPILHQYATVDTNTVVYHTIWYRGSIVRCAEFDYRFNAQLVSAQRGLRVLSRDTNETLDWILEYAPTTTNQTYTETTPAVDTRYSPFALIYNVYIPPGAVYASGLYRDYNNFVAFSGLPIDFTVANYFHLPSILPGSPRIISAGTPSPDGTVGTPAPPGAIPVTAEFPTSLTSGYTYRATLQQTTSSKIDVLWKLNPDVQTLEVLMLGYNINGYLAIGFSSEGSQQMQNADIAIGIVNPGGIPCTQPLYSTSTNAAPSAVPTMLIRNPVVGTSGAGMYFSFERDYDASAHTEGKIPLPPNNPITRVIWASKTAAVTVTSCGSHEDLPYTNLYHGVSPHGSAMMNWASGLISSSTPVPPSTPAPPATVARTVFLRAQTVPKQTIKYRGFDVPAYCAPSVYSDGSRINTQTWTPLFEDMYDRKKRLGLASADSTTFSYSTVESLYAESFDTIFAENSGQPPTMFFFFANFNSSTSQDLTQLQYPLVNDFLGSPSYTGVFRIIYLTVDARGLSQNEFNWQTISNLATLKSTLTAANFTRISSRKPWQNLVWTLSPSILFNNDDTAKINMTDRATDIDERMWINCPAINRDTILEVASDNVAHPSFNLYVAGAPLVCIFFGNGYAREVPNHQEYYPPLTYSSSSSTTTNGIITPTRMTVTDAYKNVAWNITENSLASSVSGLSPIVDSLRFPLYRVAPIRQTASGTITSAEEVASKSTFLSSVAIENGTYEIINCIPLLDASTLKTSVKSQSSFTIDQPITSYFQGRTVKHVEVEPVHRSANEFEINVGHLYVMLRGGTTIGTNERASDHPAYISQMNVPGSLSETAVFQLVGVDVGTRNSTILGQYTNYTDISTLPMMISNTYLHCVFVPTGTIIGGVTIPMETVYIDNTAYQCANFGVPRWPRSTGALPKIYELVNNAGTELNENNLHESVPGRDSYFGMAWVQRATLLDTPSSTISSTTTLLTSVRLTISTPFRVPSIFIASITVAAASTSVQTLDIITSDISGNPILQRKAADTSSLLAAPVNFFPSRATQYSSFALSSFTITNATASSYTPASFYASLPTVYFFRRGPTLESSLIETQPNVVDKLPGETSYSSSSGSVGYADLFKITIIVIPSNITSTSVIQTSAAVVSLLNSNTPGIYSVPTTTLASIFVASKAPNQTLDTSQIFAAAFLGQSQSCADIQVYGGTAGSLIDSLLCGYVDGTGKTGAEVATETVVGSINTMSANTFVVAPFFHQGWSFKVAARLDVANPFITEEYRVTRLSPAFTDSHSVTASIIGSSSNLLNNETAIIGRKYVFRSGPHLYGSAKITNLLPVIDRFPTAISTTNAFARAQAYELVVVNVEGSYWKRVNATQTESEVYAALSISRVSDVTNRAESNCWVIRPTGILESAITVATTTTISPLFGTKTETVYFDGARFTHYVLSEALAKNVNFVEEQYVVGIFSGTTFVSFLFPLLPSAPATAVISDRFSLYRVVRVQIEDLDYTKLSAGTTTSTVSSSTSVETFASSILGMTYDSSIGIQYSALETALAAATLSNATRSNSSLWSSIHITQVSARPYVAPLAGKVFERDQFYAEGSASIAYRFYESKVVSSPAPLYTFYSTNTIGGRITTAAQPILVHIPGDVLYSDLHEKFECAVSSSSTSWTPSSASDVSDAMQSGIIQSCASTGIYGYVVVNDTSNVQTEDIYNSVSNRRGFLSFYAYHDSIRYRIIVSGTYGTTAPTLASLPVVADLFNGQVLVQRGSILERAPTSTVGEFYRICSVYPVASGSITSLAAGQIKNYTVLQQQIGFGSVTMNCSSDTAVFIVPTPSLDQTTGSSLIFDDYKFDPSNGLMPLQWGFGYITGAGNPYVVQYPPFLQGTIRVNLFTGETDEPALGETVFTSANSLQFGTSADFSWTLTVAPLPASSANNLFSRRWGDQPFYGVSETNIDFRIQAKSSVWVAVAFVSSDRPFADVYLSYVGEPTRANPTQILRYQREGYYNSKTFVVHPSATLRDSATPITNANGTTTFTSAIKDYYRYRSTSYNGNTSRSPYVWQSVTSRMLSIPDDLTTVDLGQGQVTLLWASGSWNTLTQSPGPTLQRGVAVVDFTSSGLIPTYKGLPSTWVIITVIVMVVFWLLIGIVAHRIVMGRLLYSRPFISMCEGVQGGCLHGASGFVWFFGGATLAQLLSWFWYLTMLTVWSIGAQLDAEDWRSRNPSIIALFRALQFCMYFVLLPLPRKNFTFFCFGVSTNRGQLWQISILVAAFIISLLWTIVAAAGEMIVTGSDIVCSCVLTVCLFYWLLLEIGCGRSRATTLFPSFMIRRQPRLIQRALVIAGAVACILIIEYTTVYGMIPAILFVLVDIFYYCRDMQGRTGFIRSGKVFNHDEDRATIAVECMMTSDPRPENSWSMGVFDTQFPGAFCLVAFDEFEVPGASIPLVIGAIQQESEIPFAATSLHIRCTHFDTASASGSGIPWQAARSIPEFLLRAADQEQLEQRAITLYGPFGGMELSTTEYSTLVLVCAGVGAASTISVLENLIRDPELARTSAIKLIEFVWVLRDIAEAEAYRFEIETILQSIRSFQVHFTFYLTSTNTVGHKMMNGNSFFSHHHSPIRQPNFSDNEQEDDDEEEDIVPQENFDSFYGDGGDEMQQHRKPKNAKRAAQYTTNSSQNKNVVKRPKTVEEQVASFYDEGGDDDNEEEMQQQQNIHNNNNTSLYSPGNISPRNASVFSTGTGTTNNNNAGALTEAENAWVEVADLYRGRPLWEDVLHQIKIDASVRSEDSVALFVSAPRAISRAVSIAAEVVSDWSSGTSFHVETEKFDEW